mgnify:CR=1 FL=1
MKRPSRGCPHARRMLVWDCLSAEAGTGRPPRWRPERFGQRALRSPPPIQPPSQPASSQSDSTKPGAAHTGSSSCCRPSIIRPDADAQ